MGWMVKLAKGDFVGRDAAAAAKEAGSARKLVTFEVSVAADADSEPADCIGNEPIWHDGAVVGWVTSGGYAHHSQLSVALGYVPAEHAASNGPWEIEVVGVMRSARLLTEAPFDPSGARMRS